MSEIDCTCTKINKQKQKQKHKHLLHTIRIFIICPIGSNEVKVADHESQEIPGTPPSPPRAADTDSVHKPVAAKQIASIRVTTLLVS